MVADTQVERVSLDFLGGLRLDIMAKIVGGCFSHQTLPSALGASFGGCFSFEGPAA